MRERDMFTSKLNLVAPVLGIIIASIQPAFAAVSVPGPIIGAGLPVLAVLGGGYWLIRKLRDRR
jgi:lipopolysaccharide export LptBFGC system permease protein LptF